MGVSTVLSSIILASVLLVIVGTASYTANNAINFQLEEAQFEQAKNVIISLDKLIKKAKFSTGSSGYVRASFQNMEPQFTQGDYNLTLTLSGGTQNWTYNFPINTLKIKAGSYVGINGHENLIGTNSVFVDNLYDSLGRVSIYQLNGAWLTLDYSRARCLYTGVTDFYNGTDYEAFNIFEVTLINITIGEVDVATNSFLIAENIGLSTAFIEIAGNFEITVTSETDETSKSLVDLGGDPAKGSLVNMVFINMKISIFGGV